MLHLTFSGQQEDIGFDHDGSSERQASTHDSASSDDLPPHHKPHKSLRYHTDSTGRRFIRQSRTGSEKCKSSCEFTSKREWVTESVDNSPAVDRYRREIERIEWVSIEP